MIRLIVWVVFLASCGVEPPTTDMKTVRTPPSLKTKLIKAIRDNNYKKVKMLIDDGVDVNFLDDRWDTPLNLAAKYKRVEIVRMLIDADADVNLRDGEKQNSIHSAVEEYRVFDSQRTIEILRMLIDAGAKVNLRNSYGEVPFDSVRHMLVLETYDRTDEDYVDAPLLLVIHKAGSAERKAEAVEIARMLTNAGAKPFSDGLETLKYQWEKFSNRKIVIYTKNPMGKLGLIRFIVGRYYENDPSRTKGSAMATSRICNKCNIFVDDLGYLRIYVTNSTNDHYKTIEIGQAIRHATHVEIGQVEKGGDSIYISVLVDKSAHVFITDSSGAIIKHTEAELIENEFKERRVVWEANNG